MFAHNVAHYSRNFFYYFKENKNDNKNDKIFQNKMVGN